MIAASAGSFPGHSRNLHFYVRATEEEWTEMNEGVQKGMKEGWARPVINKIYQLQDAYVAHQDVIVNDGSKGKIIVNLE